MSDHSNAATGAGAAAPAHHQDGHPTWTVYWKVALVLTIITIVEVSAYFTPVWEESWIYVPSMLLMSAAKFAIVVLFYMHLRYDHKLFRSLFTGPLIVALIIGTALLFLFGHLSARLGLMG